AKTLFDLVKLSFGTVAGDDYRDEILMLLAPL
ncbi:hypothetical protein GA0115261_121056, partial [Streptomyces sp. OspMP-M43]